MRASSAVNRPPWNSAETSGTAPTASASAAGRHQQHRQFGRLALDVAALPRFAGADMAADRGQDRGAERRADDAKRQLVEAVGLVEIAQRAGAEPGREKVSYEQLADLIDARAERRRNDHANEFRDAAASCAAGRSLRTMPARAHASDQQRELEHAADE